jgi:competence protein ComEA
MLLRRVFALGLAMAVALALAAGPALAAPQAAAKAAPATKVDLNTATAEQLTELPGVGPKLAERIVEYRQKNGGFHEPRELMNVRGIGEKSYQRIEPWLTVGQAKKASAK